MEQIVDETLFNKKLKNAQTIAHDCYYRHELMDTCDQDGKNYYLKRTKTGEFLLWCFTRWEPSTVEELTKNEAKEWYDNRLKEHILSWEEAKNL